MATVVTTSGPVINIATMDADYTAPTGQLKSIQFVPGAPNDVLVVKNIDASGAIMVQFTAAATTSVLTRDFPGGVGLTPFIDYGECTLSAGHQVILIYSM